MEAVEVEENQSKILPRDCRDPLILQKNLKLT
jgi:hypothetical protein